jgi:hypothetical protein
MQLGNRNALDADITKLLEALDAMWMALDDTADIGRARRLAGCGVRVHAAFSKCTSPNWRIASCGRHIKHDNTLYG